MFAWFGIWNSPPTSRASGVTAACASPSYSTRLSTRPIGPAVSAWPWKAGAKSRRAPPCSATTGATPSCFRGYKRQRPAPPLARTVKEKRRRTGTMHPQHLETRIQTIVAAGPSWLPPAVWSTVILLVAAGIALLLHGASLELFKRLSPPRKVRSFWEAPDREHDGAEPPRLCRLPDRRRASLHQFHAADDPCHRSWPAGRAGVAGRLEFHARPGDRGDALPPPLPHGCGRQSAGAETPYPDPHPQARRRYSHRGRNCRCRADDLRPGAAIWAEVFSLLPAPRVSFSAWPPGRC